MSLSPKKYDFYIRKKKELTAAIGSMLSAVYCYKGALSIGLFYNTIIRLNKE